MGNHILLNNINVVFWTQKYAFESTFHLCVLHWPKVVPAAVCKAGGESMEFVSLETWHWERSTVTTWVICLLPLLTCSIILDKLSCRTISHNRACWSRATGRLIQVAFVYSFPLKLVCEASIQRILKSLLIVMTPTQDFLRNCIFSVLDNSQPAWEDIAKL